MTDVIMPSTWMSPNRLTLIRVREALGLGRQTYADRLNEVIGAVQWPRIPVTWQAIAAWETEVRPPQFVVDAAVSLGRERIRAHEEVRVLAVAA